MKRIRYLSLAMVLVGTASLQANEQLILESASTHRYLWHAVGPLGNVGLKQKVFAPEGQKFLKLKGKLAFKPAQRGDELPGPPEADIFVRDSDDKQYAALFGCGGAAEMFGSTGYLSFPIKSDRLLDLIYLVPETFQKGVFHFGKWQIPVENIEADATLDVSKQATFRILRATTGRQIDVPPDVREFMESSDVAIPVLQDGNVFLRVELDVTANQITSDWLRSYLFSMHKFILVTDDKTLYVAVAREPIENFFRRIGDGVMRPGDNKEWVLYFMVPKATRNFVLGYCGKPVGKGQVRGTFKGSAPDVELPPVSNLKFELIDVAWHKKLLVTRRPFRKKIDLATELMPMTGGLMAVRVGAGGLKSHGLRIAVSDVSIQFGNDLVLHCAGFGYKPNELRPSTKMMTHRDEPIETTLYFITPRPVRGKFKILIHGQPVLEANATSDE